MKQKLKRCKYCGELKNLEEDFHVDTRLAGGRKHKCKECIKESRRERKQQKYEARTIVSEMGLKRIHKEKAKEDGDEKKIVVERTELPEFPWVEWLKTIQFPRIKVCASTRSGKSFLLKHLWPLFKMFYDMVLLFCQSLAGEAYDFLSEEDRELAFDDYIPEIFADEDKLERETNRALKIMDICDDCSDDTVIKYDRQMLLKHTRGRNHNQAVMTSDQSPSFLNKNSRNNVDLLVLGKMNTPDMYETVVKMFMERTIPIPERYTKRQEKIDYMCEWIREHTTNPEYTFIIVDFYNNRKIYQYRVNGDLDLSGLDNNGKKKKT